MSNSETGKRRDEQSAQRSPLFSTFGRNREERHLLRREAGTSTNSETGNSNADGR